MLQYKICNNDLTSDFKPRLQGFSRGYARSRRVCPPPEYAPDYKGPRVNHLNTPDLLSFPTNLNPSLRMKTGNFLRHIDAEGGTRLQLHLPPHVPV